MEERKITRPSGFKGKMTDKYLIGESKYGQRYFCTSCGRIALGTTFRDDNHHHKAWCKWMHPKETV